jgi:alkylhydroperoxidase family enzyme
MARLPYVDPEQAPEAVRETLAKLPVKLNIFRMMAHAETNFRPLILLGTSILSQQKLDPRLRELAILRVASLSKAAYEWVQHVPIGKATGLTDAQIAALERQDAKAASFDDRDRMVLDFTTEMVREVRVSDAVFERAKGQLSPQEVVELSLAVGYYMMIARLLETTAVDIEAPQGTKIIESMKR